MQLCMRKVDTKAVITVRMKLPILSAGIFWKSFIKLNFKLLNDIFLQGEPCSFSTLPTLSYRKRVLNHPNPSLP